MRLLDCGSSRARSSLKRMLPAFHTVPPRHPHTRPSNGRLLFSHILGFQAPTHKHPKIGGFRAVGTTADSYQNPTPSHP